MQKKISNLIIVILIFPVFSFAQDVLGIKDAVNIAMKDNHDIKIAKNNVKIAENNASVMNSGYLPTLSSNGSVSKKKEDTFVDLGGGATREVDGAKTDAYSYGISLNYRLFDGLGRYYNYQKFQSSYSLTELQARAVIENTLMKLIVSYYDVAKLSSKIENQKRTIEISNERMTRTESQFAYGQATKLDLLRAEVDKNNDSINYMNTYRELQIAKRDFNVVLARDVRTDFKADTVVLFGQDILEDTMMNLALEQNVDYLIAMQNVGIAELDKKSRRSGYMPKVDLNGGYSGNSVKSTGGAFLANEAQGYNGGLSLSWNIFDGGRTHVQVQNAKIAEENAQEQVYNQENNLMREVSNAYVNYQNLLFIMQAELKNMQTNKLNFSYSKDKFDLGQINSIDYRKAQVDLEGSINRYNDAKYSAKVAELQLMKLAGLFMQEVNN